MEPSLVAIAGPLMGSTFPVAGVEITVGRDSGNALRIADALLSRRHCAFRRDPDGVSVVDLGSLNGTFVNDVPIRERRLRHGDQVALGDTVLLVLLPDHAAIPSPPPAPVTLSDEDFGLRTTERRTARDGAPADVEPPVAGAAVPRHVRDLGALLRIGMRVGAMRGTSRVAREILATACETLGADRGAVLLVEVPGEDPVPAASWHRDRSREAELRVSRTVVQQVLAEHQGVLCAEVAASERLHEAGSLAGQRVHSLLCVPLVLREQALGVLYVDRLEAAVPFDSADLDLATAVAGIAALGLENARGLEVLENENRRLQRTSGVEHEMVGESQAMWDVYQRIARVAPTDSTVLLLGESGTGKELAARAIHLNSDRATRPFVVVNCAVLSDTLLESDLFGHEKGAFTGAIARKKGKVELADGGTLFLDEVSEMSPALQAKLLRVVQEREFERVGGTTPIRVDVRVIAATNRDLEAEMGHGRFRQDLFYRLNVVSLRLPPLRERKQDIPLLAAYFAAKYAAKFKRRVTGISFEARDVLMSHDWPGNVRELQNAIERAVVLGNSERILSEDLPEHLFEAEAPAVGKVAGYHGGVREAKKSLILGAMREAGGRFTEAAAILGVHPNYLHRLVRNLNLRGVLRAAHDPGEDH